MRSHISGCVNKGKNSDKWTTPWTPAPDVDEILKSEHNTKVKMPSSPFDFCKSSLENQAKCMKAQKHDTVALRMFSLMMESDNHIFGEVPGLYAHRENVRAEGTGGRGRSGGGGGQGEGAAGAGKAKGMSKKLGLLSGLKMKDLAPEAPGIANFTTGEVNVLFRHLLEVQP